MGVLEEGAKKDYIIGIIIGLIAMPVGLLAGGITLGIGGYTLLYQSMPVFSVC